MKNIPANQQAPIALFDSGVGGLSVLRALRQALPEQWFVYLGDTARLPYGSRSPRVVQQYASMCAHFLKDFLPKLMVIACNTACAHALGSLQQQLAFPVVGVIEPGALAACQQSLNKKLAVLATHGTIRSQAYQQAIFKHCPEAFVLAQACPMLVPLAEEGLIEHPATELLLRNYLEPIKRHGIDTVILGCTHYPLFHTAIRRILGEDIAIVDSAESTAMHVKALLKSNQNLAKHKENQDRFYVTDLSEHLEAIGNRFLGQTMQAVEQVDLKTP